MKFVGDFLNISVSQMPSEHSKTHFPANLSRPKFVKFVREYLLYFFYEIQKPCIPNWCRLQILKLNLTSNNYPKLSKPLGSLLYNNPPPRFSSPSEIFLVSPRHSPFITTSPSCEKFVRFVGVKTIIICFIRVILERLSKHQRFSDSLRVLQNSFSCKSLSPDT